MASSNSNNNMEIKTPTRLIFDYLVPLDKSTLEKACKFNPTYKKVCTNENFWKEKVKYDYGNETVRFENNDNKTLTWKSTWNILSKNTVKMVLIYSILSENGESLEATEEEMDEITSLFNQEWLYEIIGNNECRDKIKLFNIIVDKYSNNVELLFVFENMDRQKCIDLLFNQMDEWSFDAKIMSKNGELIELGPVMHRKLI